MECKQASQMLKKPASACLVYGLAGHACFIENDLKWHPDVYCILTHVNVLQEGEGHGSKIADCNRCSECPFTIVFQY